MIKNQQNAIYDLEESTFQLVKRMILWVNKTTRTFEYMDDFKQLINACGSVGINYIAANDTLSKRILRCKSEYRVKKQKNSHTGYDLF